MVRKLTVLLFFSVLGYGQDAGKLPRTVPPIFALQGATVVLGNGSVLTNATVVVRDGLIEAVGTNVAIPPLAWQIDLSGMYVYPGLIDALTSEGFKRAPSSRPAAPGPGGPPPSSQESDEPGMFAHVRAADRLESDITKLSAWRDAGILTLHVAPDSGIFRGQSALANLNGDGADRMIVRSPVAMTMSFQGAGGFRTYPGSLMGVLAYIKQNLLNAQHYGMAQGIYSSGPSGLKRPETNRNLEALQPAVQGSMPLLFPAQREREILRVLEMAENLKVKCIVAGGFEAPQVSAKLKEKQVPVLLSLNFPEKERDAHPEAEESLEALRYRLQAPKSAAELHKAGVRFAFYSDSLKSGRDFLKNLRAAVKEGLPKEAALQAATLSAAQILGVDQQLGSVEKGKIANLVVTDRDLFDDNAQIKHVFVDGEKYDIPAEEKREEQKGESERVPGVLGGLWNVEVTSPDTTYRIQFDLTQEGGSLTGRVVSPEAGSLPLYGGNVSGESFSFKIRVDFGGGPQEITFSGTLAGDEVSGTAQVENTGAVPFKGRRAPR